MPVLIRASGIETVGYSNENPGGYGEFMRLTERLLLEVPNGLSTERAALTEPLAVGYHAVARRRGWRSDDAPLVIGCGPVGLAVIAALKLKGVHPIVAADFSPRRRATRAADGRRRGGRSQERSRRTKAGARWPPIAIPRTRRNCRPGCRGRRCGRR